MPHPMRFGLAPGNRLSFPESVRQWQMTENLGFDSAWVVDHFFSGQDELGDYHEAWTLIAALGALTNRIRFGIMVSGNTYRNPGLLAKQAVTIDHASNGRLELGIGAGWMEREHEAYSYRFPSVGERIEMLEESVQIIRSLMTEERTNFDGKHYTFVNAPLAPKPLQKPHIPIVIGAFKPRMQRLAARYADTWNTRGTPEDIAPQAEQVRKAAEQVGRDPNEIRFSVYTWEHPFESPEHFRKLILEYRELGFTDFIFPVPPEDKWPVLEQIARDVIPELRRMS